MNRIVDIVWSYYRVEKERVIKFYVLILNNIVEVVWSYLQSENE